jgi:hypothetical protein
VIGTKNRIPMLRVNLRNTLNLFWIFFFFFFRYYGYSGKYRLLLQFLKVSLSIVSLKYQIMDLCL